jgi:hypothetical protein
VWIRLWSGGLIIRGSNVGTRQSFRSSPNHADYPLARPGSGSKGTVGYFPEKLSDLSLSRNAKFTLHKPSCPKTTSSLHYPFQRFYIVLRCFYRISCFCLQGKERWRHHVPPKVGMFLRDIMCQPMRQLNQVSGTELT